MVGNVRGPPGGRDKDVPRTDDQRIGTVKQICQAVVGRKFAIPLKRIKVALIHQDDPNVVTGSLKLQRQIEYAQVAGEQVLKFDFRNQNVDASLCVTSNPETQWRNLLRDEINCWRYIEFGLRVSFTGPTQLCDKVPAIT